MIYNAINPPTTPDDTSSESQAESQEDDFGSHGEDGYVHEIALKAEDACDTALSAAGYGAPRISVLAEYHYAKAVKFEFYDKNGDEIYGLMSARKDKNGADIHYICHVTKNGHILYLEDMTNEIAIKGLPEYEAYTKNGALINWHE